jgi:transcription elongation factor Elf1
MGAFEKQIPCPHCGSPKVTIMNRLPGELEGRVICNWCGSMAYISWWNKRYKE